MPPTYTRSPLALSCSLHSAVAVPTGPGDVLHGKLPAPDEGTSVLEGDVSGSCMGRLGP